MPLPKLRLLTGRQVAHAPVISHVGCKQLHHFRQIRLSCHADERAAVFKHTRRDFRQIFVKWQIFFRIGRVCDNEVNGIIFDFEQTAANVGTNKFEVVMRNFRRFFIIFFCNRSLALVSLIIFWSFFWSLSSKSAGIFSFSFANSSACFCWSVSLNASATFVSTSSFFASASSVFVDW